MKKILLTITTFAFIFFAAAQKTIYDANAQQRTVKSFHSISISGGIDLFLTHGEEAVAVSASDTKYLVDLKTEVENGTLKIWFDYRGNNKIIFTDRKNLKAYVSYKILNKLSASGGSDISVDGTIKSSDLILNISGGSDFKGKVDVNELVVDQSGGSDMDIQGRATRISIEASGGSDFNGYNLITETCSVEASGGSDIEISVNKELSAKASGASDITYKGNPAIKELKASGAGSVNKKS